MFLNRTHEVADIKRFLASQRSELLILYGRRGVGKSALIAEALSGQTHLYYQATTRALVQQLEDLSEGFRSFASDMLLPGQFPSCDAFLDAVTRVARSRSEAPTIVVIDELPYLAAADPPLPTVIQRWWDGVKRADIRNIKMLLLGSSVSWMEENTLTDRGAIYNRRTGQIKLDPFDYRNAALFYSEFDSQDKIGAFAIWGGMPSYLEGIDPARRLWENVHDAILQFGTRLGEEPSWLRFTELRNDVLYASIVRAIALRNHRPSEIARAAGRTRADEIAFALERLCDLRLVERIVPIHEADHARSRHARYVLADHYLAFWYTFVDRLRHLLGARRHQEALHRIQGDFDRYLSGRAFEDVCRQYLWQAMAAGRLPQNLEFDQVGSWWVARKETPDEIDVVAMESGRAVLIGECKWSRQPMDRRDLDGLSAALRAAGEELRPADRPWRALFSRSGFSHDLQGLAINPEERLLLVTPDDLYW